MSLGNFGAGVHGPSKEALANYYREEGEAALAKATGHAPISWLSEPE